MERKYLLSVGKAGFPRVAQRRWMGSLSARSSSWKMVSIKEYLFAK